MKNTAQAHKTLTIKLKPHKRFWLFTLVMFLAIGLTVSLGFWQLGREQEKKRLFDDFVQRQKTVLLFEQIEPGLNSQYQKLRVQGQFDNQHNFLLDNRVQDGQVGYNVITPFLPQNSKKWVLINRGFIPLGASRAVLPTIAPVNGTVLLEGLFYQPQGKNFVLDESHQMESGWPKRMENIDFERIEQILKQPVFHYEILLTTKLTNGFVTSWQPGTIPPAKHRAYAVQWFALALTLVILYLLRIVKVRRRPVTEQGTQLVMKANMKNNRMTIYLLLAIFIVPMIFAWILYHDNGGMFKRQVNMGHIIAPPLQMDDLVLYDRHGHLLSSEVFEGHWTFLYIDPKNCGTNRCVENLYKMRQVRTALGKDSNRVQRVLLTLNGQKKQKAANERLVKLLSQSYVGTEHYTTTREDLTKFLGRLPSRVTAEKSGYLYVIDPLGNLMMSFPTDVKPKNLLDDMRQLLKFSHIG